MHLSLLTCSVSLCKSFLVHWFIKEYRSLMKLDELEPAAKNETAGCVKTDLYLGK